MSEHCKHRHFKGDKFKSLEECLLWLLDKKPVFAFAEYPVLIAIKDYKIRGVCEGWREYHKAVSVSRFVSKPEKGLKMTNKELSPEEAYKALIDGKVIENECTKYKLVDARLYYLATSGRWCPMEDYRTAEFFTKLTGYHLARKKVKKEIRCWANLRNNGFVQTWSTRDKAIFHNTDNNIATAVEMTGYYEAWEDEE